MTSSTNPVGIEGDLQKQIDASRAKLTAALQELSHVVKPSTQAGFVAEDLKYQAQDAQYKVMNTIDEARDGDADAIKKLLIAAGVVVGTVAALVAIRALRKHFRR